VRGEVRIRVARADEVGAVIALERAILTAPHWAEREYAGMVEADEGGSVRRRLLVGEEETNLVGFAVGRVIGAGAGAIAELESVVVAETARRVGVGRALCEAVITWCGASGAAGVELEVRSANAAAIALYRRLGFLESGRRKGYYSEPKDDAVLMQLEMAGWGREGSPQRF
jgi:ribosomal-protein-alanine N-acetyltransferase